MESFKQFYTEAETGETTKILHQIEGGLTLGSVKELVKQSGAEDVDALIEALKKSPQVQKVLALYKRMKAQAENQKEHFVIDEGIGDWILSGLSSIGRFFLKGVVSLLKTLFVEPFKTDASAGEKFVYAAGLIAIFLSAPVLIGLAAPSMGLGAATAGVLGTFVPGFNLTWWIMQGFMHTFFKPFIEKWENPQLSYSY